MVAFDGLLSVTVNVSSPSTRVSPLTYTVMILRVSPGENVNVPRSGEKSSEADGVRQSTVTRCEDDSLRVTAKVMPVVPLSPSLTRASAIDSVGSGPSTTSTAQYA